MVQHSKYHGVMREYIIGYHYFTWLNIVYQNMITSYTTVYFDIH